MSNLSSGFDILRGWPNGAAVDDNYVVSTGVTLTEGLLAVYDSGVTSALSLTLPTAVAAQGAATGPTKFRMVIQGNDQFDASFVGQITTLRGAFTVQTQAFVSGSYTPGELLTVSVAVDSNQGKLKARTGANEQVVGEVESYDSVNGLLVVSMAI